jgi:hypothetical protein
MIGRAVRAGVPFRWVAGDEAYGGNPGLREWLEAEEIPYVLAIACNAMISTKAGAKRADELAGLVPAGAWQRLSCADGSKGPRLYDWALVATGSGDHWLLARRSLQPGEKGDLELAFYRCYCPRPVTLAELVAVAGARWGVGLLRRGQGRGRPGPLPGPPLPRLVPAHHPVHARARVPRRHRACCPPRPGTRPAAGTRPRQRRH